jgi:hypothetical protein
MFEKRKYLLALVCLCIIGGVIFNAIYIEEKNEKSVHAIRTNKELVKKTLVEIKPQTKIRKYEKFLSDGSQNLAVIEQGHFSNTYLVTEPEFPVSNIIIMKAKKPGGGHNINMK